jgi:erythromycin esterase-like protein
MGPGVMSGFAAAAFLALAAQKIPVPPALRSDTQAMDSVVGDLCRRDIAMLGEASHGDGRTFEFKTELVRRLVEECGYDAVYFESSHYDFLEFSRRVRTDMPVTPEILSSSIGGIWNRHREVQPLIRYLFDKAKAGRLQLGGLDDQLGSAGAFFSIAEMPERLTSDLAEGRRSECREAIRRRIYSDYSRDAPYGEPQRVKIGTCLREIGQAAGSVRNKAERSDRLQMVRNVERYIARDFADGGHRLGQRDRSMYLNFRWLAGRMPPRSKIIVWSATAHVAREAGAAPGFAGIANFGSYVHRTYGRRAFALGFSALTGSYREIFMSKPGDLGIAAPDSIEGRTLGRTGLNTAYCAADCLARAGRVPGGIFSHRVASADWSRTLDGLVVFRAEHPPQPVE